MLTVDFFRKLKILGRTLSRPRRLVNVVRNFRGIRRRDDHLNYMPYRITLEPTARCNIHCSMCQNSTWDRNPHDLTLEGFRKVLDQFPTLMVIKLHGIGEPLLNKEFYAMVEEAVARGISVETVTNGTALTERICRRLLDCGLSDIYISVDGATPETFERIRAGAKFSKVIEGARRLTGMRGTRRHPGVHFWTTGQVGNIDELPDIVRLAKDVGVDSLQVNHDLVYWGQDEWQDKLKAQALSVEQSQNGETFIQQAREVAKALSLPFKVYTEGKFSWDEGRLCHWPWSTTFVSSEGYVVPCGVIGNQDVLNFGNVLTENFEDIWNGHRYQDFRQKMKRGEIADVCKGCYENRSGEGEPRRETGGFVALGDVKKPLPSHQSSVIE